MCSPVSAFGEQSEQHVKHQRVWAPTTPLPDITSIEQPPRGLGIFNCPMPQQHGTVEELPPSPRHSDGWSRSSIIGQEYLQSTQPPNLSTAAFDAFSGYTNHHNSAMLSAPSDETPGLVFCQTPPSTNIPSHPSSVSSSCSPSLQHAQYYTPGLKPEDQGEWYTSPSNKEALQRPSITDFMPYSSGASPISGPTEDLYKTHCGDWSKPGQEGQYPMELDKMVGEESRSRFEGGPLQPGVGRIIKRRKKTTPEEATHECAICGKLFKRSYNWKSHMETHNPERRYPHPCTAMIGNQPCMKKFQRKTDLDRHYDSVHLKARNHRCDQCGNRFARRDTLRR
ncbi:MAG: hypothetical protein Q9163_002763 [Psora crenata]